MLKDLFVRPEMVDCIAKGPPLLEAASVAPAASLNCDAVRCDSLRRVVHEDRWGE